MLSQCHRKLTCMHPKIISQTSFASRMSDVDAGISNYGATPRIENSVSATFPSTSQILRDTTRWSMTSKLPVRCQRKPSLSQHGVREAEYPIESLPNHAADTEGHNEVEYDVLTACPMSTQALYIATQCSRDKMSDRRPSRTRRKLILY